MSIRNTLKSALLAMTAAATLLLALPSQAGDHRDRDGSRAAYGWQAGDHRDGRHRRGDDRRDHRQDHRHAHYRYSSRHPGYHDRHHGDWRGNHRDDHRRHDDWRHRDHRGYR